MTSRAGAAIALIAPALGLAASGCAFAPGEPFGALEATLEARLEAPADRVLGDGFQRLASDWQVRVVRLDVVVGEVIVEAAGDASGAVAFDPASPPRGYGLCHGGHCHADDGRLVSYEDVEAELAAAAGDGATAVVAMEGGALDAAGGERRALDCGACALDEGHLAAVRVGAQRLVVELLVRDGRPTPRIEGTFTVQGEIDLSAAGAEPGAGRLRAALDVDVDEDAPPVVALAMTLAPGVALFDHVDFVALPTSSGARDLAPAADAIRAAFDTLELEARVTRRDD